MATRRQVLGAAGAALLFGPGLVRAAERVDITMTGRPNGSHVWFEPAGLLVAPGTSVRWTNRDKANAHTSTAYHPSIFGRQARIPPGATPWDSDYLLEGESFEVTLEVPGVYDFYCVPHEHAGMVGRIIVGRPGVPYPDTDPDPTLMAPPQVALANLPDVEAIIAAGQIWID